MARYAKINENVQHTSVSLRNEILDAVHEYMSDTPVRNRSVAIETLLEEILKEKGYIKTAPDEHRAT